MRITPLLLLTCLVATACGDDSTDEADTETTTTATASSTTTTTTDASASVASSSSSGTPGECQVLTVTESVVLFGGAGLGGLSMRVDPSLAGYAKTRLTLELYQDPGTPALATGTFDLTATPDDNYGTCQHCNLLVTYDGLDQPRGTFFQSRGDMVLDHYDPDLFTLAGRVEGLRLVEVTQSPEDFAWHVVDHGRCFDVPDFEFDTRPVDGAPCERAEDCPNEAWQACDVATKTCVQAPCRLGGDGPFCPSDQRCMSQLGALIGPDEGGPIAGACYVDCVPGADGCASGETCLPLGPVQDVGICLAVGTAPIGGACNLPDVSTGCVEGALCDEPGVCRELCDYLSPVTGCDAGTFCTQYNMCEPLDRGDIAMVGGICDPLSQTFTDCGPEGDSFRGLCVDVFEHQPKECLRLCSTVANDCPGSQECLLFFDNPLVGICHVPPVCGDGVLDLVGGEICDDDNTVDGDGCSADCKTVELGPLCGLAEPLVSGVLSVGSNVGGVTGYPTSCSAYPYSPSKTYSFTPPAPGKLHLRLDSIETLALSVLGDCADETSELDCSEDQFLTGSQTLTINFTEGGNPALVVVRGAPPVEMGTFFLLGTFAPAACGDGDIGGAEACDDGNLVGGDGCAADCSAVDWNQVCTNLPMLDLAAPITSTLDAGASQFFDLNGECSIDGTLERAYQFTAPSDGTLTLSLASDDDLVAYAGNGCGPVTFESYLTCINWLPEPGEVRTTTTTLTAGQRVTVVIEGFRSTEAGAFTLTSSFAP